MTDISFSEDSILMSASPEQRAVVALSMCDTDVSRDIIDDIFTAHLNWPWICMQAMHHRTIALLWDTLKHQDLLKAAFRAGLAKNWIAYCEQISRASQKRNLRWLECIEWIFEEFAKAGLDALCIKGGALIGDIYTPETRMLGDVDSIIRPENSNEVNDVLHGLGFRQGSFNPISLEIEPFSRERQLFWSINSHVVPKYTLLLDDPDCPFLRFSVGFNFFDPGESFSYPSDIPIANKVKKQGSANVMVADDVDTIINLAAHIYREGSSATLGYAGDNWNLWKFTDFRTKLMNVEWECVRGPLQDRLTAAKIEKVMFYALYFTRKIYGDPGLDQWFDVCGQIDDLAYLTEMRDGDKRVTYDRAFDEQLFDTARVIAPGLVPTWSKVMPNGEWW